MNPADETAAPPAPDRAGNMETERPEPVAQAASQFPIERPVPRATSREGGHEREGLPTPARTVTSAPAPDDRDVGQTLAVLEHDAAQARGQIEAAMLPDSGNAARAETAPPSVDPDDLAIGPALAALGRSALGSPVPTQASPGYDGSGVARIEVPPPGVDPDDVAIAPALAALGQSAPVSRVPTEASRGIDGSTAGRSEIAAPVADPDDLAIRPALAALGWMADRSVKATGSFHVTAAVRSADGLAAALDMAELETRIQTETAQVYVLGADSVDLDLDTELAKLAGAAARLPSPVRQRLGDTYGIRVTQTLTRFQSLREADQAAAEIRGTEVGERAPQWLERLADAVLRDAGAQTREGLRTAGLHIHSGEETNGSYLAIDDDGSYGYLTVAELVRQAHLGMTFACDAWTGLETLRLAGREGAWALQAGVSEDAGLAASELDLLRAAGQMERELRRIERAQPPANRAATASEQAALAVQALTAVGPTGRSMIGWPGSEAAPNPRSTYDVVRVATMAGVLREHVRSISNRLIATSIIHRPVTNA